MTSLELWGGVECSVVRIGEEVRDQCRETGHFDRPGDLDAIAGLGIKTLRYPILWDTVERERGTLDFAWHDERLAKLRELGIRVIGGLVHHGSGPRGTDVLDRDWSARLGDYANKVAERYPWIDTWVPVNEPLTTARFGCLYGHWYPHKRSLADMIRSLVIQCEGIAAAMRAIRAVNPGALLLATEDLGKTFATRPLWHQARHENRRRWLSLDILTGRVTRRHPLADKFEEAGVSRDRLALFESGETVPDLIAVDHYLTSERYLDHRIDLYPAVEPGGNGRQAYVDLEAVRIPRLAGKVGPAHRLREAWERYRIPLVYGEVHHGCSREEQLRWFDQVWRESEMVRGEGVDIRAVTLWAMFGVVDWRSLLTRREGHYDSGAFDIRSPEPRPTLIAKAAAAYARDGQFEHPALELPGWWKRPERTYAQRKSSRHTNASRPILITGATGTLGQAFARICRHRGLDHVLTDRTALDIADPASIDATIDRYKPWAVVNAAGFVRVDEAEANAVECFRANADGPANLALACQSKGLPLVTFSSDLVFDGSLGRAYIEPDSPAPAGAYGRSKVEAERRVLDTHGDALVVRSSAFFGPWDRYNFLYEALGRLARGEEIEASASQRISPTYIPELVQVTLDLLLDEASGLWHLANQGSISWHELACEAADRAGLDRKRIRASNGSYADTSLSSERGGVMRPLDQALDAYVREAAPALGA